MVSLNWIAATDDQAVKGYNVYENDDYKTTVFGTEYTGTVEADTPHSYYIVAFDFDRNFAKRTDTISISGATGMTDNTIATDDNDTTDDTDATDGSDSNGDADANNDSDSNHNAGDDTDSNDGANTDDNDATDGADTEDDLENVVDTEAPSAPTNLVGTWTQNGDTADINLEWTASTDNVAIAGYNIYENKRYLTTVGQTAFSTTVNSGSPYSYRIVAFDIARNFSRPSFSRTLPDGDNLAPVFAGLENQTAFAGETVSILIKPTDIDGETPGLFIGSLPTGMRSDDNLNGTRTLHWRPLQPDVGSYDITVTAFDSADTALRTVQTFTLTIEMPEDESTIRNAAPGIDGIGEHLVRIGDTVVMRVKATDANGTVPNLRMENLPNDASFEQDPEEPLIKILRWKTSAGDKGLNTLKFTATDSVDPSLVANSSVPINVVEATQFNRSGERLRTLAAQKELLIGYASVLNYFLRPDADLYKATAAEEFNLVTAENSMKWGYINPEPGKYRFAAADELVSFATENNMTLHGHTLLWYTSLPQWVQTSAKDKREGIMNDFIDTMTGRYNTVAIWDVVNEAFEDDGSYRNSIWFDAMGENYIEKAFRRARAGAPNAELIYNDYDIAYGDAKTDASFTLMEKLIANDAPIDGIGFQMHIDSDFSDFDKIEATFERFANLGLDIYITEMDVSQVDGADENDQARVYKEVLRVCLEQSACKALQVWGFTDRYTWLRGDDPLLFDRDYQPKPAYRALQELLAQ